MSTDAGLPGDIVEAIAISNAQVIGEQQAILTNLAMSTEIANVNLAQQNAVNKQNALFQLEMATIGKCVEVIMSIDPTDPHAKDQLDIYQKLMQNLVQIFKQMEPTINKLHHPSADEQS
ncbi:MAG: hypothetical protein ACSI46_14350 [Gloeotrichia echinulata DVL01]|jgi:hypothetical protein